MIKTGMLIFEILLGFLPILKALIEETSSNIIYVLIVLFFYREFIFAWLWLKNYKEYKGNYKKKIKIKIKVT